MSHRNYFIKALVFSLIISPLVVGVSENTQKLIQWMRSEEGQAFIEKCGYARADI